MEEPKQGGAETTSTTFDDGYSKNFKGHLPLHWLEPMEEDSCDRILPSFGDLQLKTHRTLYGATPTKSKSGGRFRLLPPPNRDKSPKGSVDAPIQHLVDLINSHSRYCTLSSCSGRLSLFDPNGTNFGSSGEDDTSPFTEGSGKGRGRWVLVSHHCMDPEGMIKVMKLSNSESKIVDQEEQPWTFRFEPLLLHVAAASLNDGKRLLTIALNLGFRESGLVVTDKRVTVAIRSNSLTTATPLFPSRNAGATDDSTSFFVPDSYLRALVMDANRRLHANWKHLDRLYRSIETKFFAVRKSPAPLILRSSHSSLTRSLNLWNTSAISLPEQQICVVGGYGCGPKTSEDPTVARGTAKRSSKIYQIETDSHTTSGWSAWKEWDLSASDQDSTLIELLHVEWLSSAPDLQGMTLCRLKPSNMIIGWGGRRSPARPSPSEDIYVVDPTNQRFGRLPKTEQVIRGELPEPRWGHQLLALGTNDRAVLIGGCSHEAGGMKDIFVLHFVKCNQTNENKKENPYFYWEKLSTQLPMPKFHFGAVVLKDDTIVLVGGLRSTTDLLQPFEATNNYRKPTKEGSVDYISTVMSGYRFGPSKSNDSEYSSIETQCTPLAISSSEKVLLSPIVGSSCCTLLSDNLLVVTGGIATNAELGGLSPIQLFWISGYTDASTLKLRQIEFDIDCYTNPNDSDGFDFGSLVHHCCLPLGMNEFVLVGGGTPAFSFGELYAKSHHLWIDEAADPNDPINLRTNPQTVGKNPKTKDIHSGLDTEENHLSTRKSGSSNETKTKGSSFSNEPKQKTSVLYVAPKHARNAKNSLQERGWLDKRFRMIKVDLELPVTESMEENESTTQGKTKVIAIPISASFVLVLSVFNEWILHHGEEELPFSTSQYASKTSSK